MEPSPGYVWIPGYWDWNGSDYVWMSGKWMELPTPQATWVPGHWEQTGSGLDVGLRLLESVSCSRQVQ